MPSKVYMICNSYESGFGHGLANDGLDLSKTPHGDKEQGEAYQIGYEAGQDVHQRKAGANVMTTWICPKCKADRLKETCKGDRMTCPMVATAQVHNV